MVYYGVFLCSVVCPGVVYCSVFLNSVFWVFWHGMICIGVLCSCGIGFLMLFSMTWYGVFWFCCGMLFSVV